MSLAAETRSSVDDHPFLRRALRAGVVNHAAAARFLDVDGDEEAVAAAVRRYGEDLAAFAAASQDARVSMESGLGPADEGVLSVAGQTYAQGAGQLTGLVASGGADTRGLAHALDRLHADGIDPEAAGVAGGTLVVVVDRRDGPDAVRVVEDALDAVPTAAE